MKTLSFYFLLTAPLLILMLLNKLFGMDARVFSCLLLAYCVIYHPTIVGKRLLYKRAIGQDEFFKNFIPFWNMQYYSEAFT
jgi:hypothetical protein